MTPEIEEVHDPKELAYFHMQEAVREVFAAFDKYAAQMMVAEAVNQNLGRRYVNVLEYFTEPRT